MMPLLAQVAGDSLEYMNQTSVHPVGAVLMLILSGLALVLPRQWAMFPLIVLVSFVPAGQRITFLTLDFSFLRILAIVYWVRLFVRSEFKGFRWSRLDIAVIVWLASSIAIYSLQWMQFSAFINRIGFAYETLGLYLAMRILIKSPKDVVLLAVGFSIVAVPVAALFFFEQTTGKNLFSVMGGVPAETLVREGRRRAQGAFSHPIMAGCLWATVLVLLSGCVMANKRRYICLMGSVACLVIVLSTASSTPVFAVLLGGLGMAMAYARFSIRPIRIAFPFILLALHLSMKQPVWHLIARVSAVGGSTGWHRYHLIDGAVNHYSEWALLGTRTTSHWGRGLQDVTNQFVLEGVRGGLLTLIAFIVVIVFAVKNVSTITLRYKKRTPEFWIAWSVGVAIFAQVVSFVGVSYFGQTTVAWLMTLAIAGSLAEHQRRQIETVKRAKHRAKAAQRNQDQQASLPEPAA